jgi:2-polyprenyl-3-methyl-5-hydroxy-6-metoxy-1,4-benzoquinol methylase
MNQDTIKNFYDQYTERQTRVGVNARHKSIFEKSVASGLKPNHKVLEIGCGIGTFTSLIIPYISKGSILSVDISPKSIEIAKASYSSSNLKFVATDVTEHNFDEEVFDVITLPDVLEHIPIELHHKLFGKLSKLLSPNGFVLIHIPNPYYLQWCHETRPDTYK